MLVGGGSVVIREKFSARQFWDDVVRCDCTLFQYIGELCRYLVQRAAASARDARTGCGSPAATACGADVWEAFQDRFRIPQILEFYAATEGNFSLYNVEGKPGAIGRMPPFLAHRFPAAIVRFDVDTGEPVRGADGLLHPLRGRRGRRGDRPDRRRDGERRRPVRGLHRRAAIGEEDPARRVRAGRRLVSHRRPDAHGRSAASSISSTASATPSAGRARTSPTAEVAEAIARLPRRRATPASTASSVPGADGRAGMAAIVVDDGLRSRARCARISRSACPTTPARCSCASCAAHRGRPRPSSTKKSDLAREGLRSAR